VKGNPLFISESRNQIAKGFFSPIFFWARERLGLNSPTEKVEEVLLKGKKNEMFSNGEIAAKK